MNKRKKIVVLIDWFDPAFKAGGPIRSCVNFVEHLHNEFDLYVVTGSRDLGSIEVLEGILLEEWMDYHGKARVYYCDTNSLTTVRLRNIINGISPDFIYLNSFFSRQFTLLPLWLKRRGKIESKVVLAPRGMLKASALAFKSFKKKVFIRFFRLTGIHRMVRFQATDLQEQKDILSYFPNVKIQLAPNLPGPVATASSELLKATGSVSLVFVGRVHPIKNLLFLLKAIRQVKGAVSLTIIGMNEDKEYWKECQELIEQLDTDKKVTYLGEQKHDTILKELSQHHIFVLPTRGENFGHAIFEALSLGRPVLISDQTPWKSLYGVKAGWDLPLSDPSLFTAAIEEAIEWDQETFTTWCTSSLQKAKTFIENSEMKSNYIKLFS